MNSARAQMLLLIAFGLAAVSLASLVVVRVRQPRDGHGTALLRALCLVPAAILIGTLPGVLGVTNETLRIAASIVSIIVSVAAVTLLLRAGFREGA